MNENKRVEEMTDRELLEYNFLMNLHLIKRQIALEAKLFNDNDYEKFEKILIDSIEDNEETRSQIEYEKLLYNATLCIDKMSNEELKELAKHWGEKTIKEIRPDFK